MRYFQNPQGQFFGIDAGQENLIQPDWIEATQADVDAANAPTPDQLRAQRIGELQGFLKDTDYKDLPNYDKRNTPEWNAIMAQRQAWREEIRQLDKV
jgi:hypothetical protein